MKNILFPAIFLFLAVPALRAQAPGISGAPAAIRELSVVIQGKRLGEVRAAIIQRLGPAQRDVGSGLRIEQWDTSGGVLTFHPGTGPSFFDQKSGATFHLMRTTNPVRSNLFGNYEMTSLPDSEKHGTRFWLGNVTIGPGMTYRFADSGQFRDKRSARAGNFFMLHPAGRVEARFRAPVERGTLLESVPGESIVADLIFISDADKSRETFSVTTSGESRYLECRAQGQPFRMGKPWNNFWQ